MGKGFSGFTYGVGLEITASSFKQVKDDLKLNLDSLSKMVKSYGKVLKIDPNADLSKLFEEMQKIKSITDGINESDNSFAGFVDKGVLTRIADLEDGLRSVSAVSKEVEANLSGLKAGVASLVDMFKQAGAVKFPQTIKNLFGSDTIDQTANIKKLKDQIKIIQNALASLDQLNLNVSDIYNSEQSHDDISVDVDNIRALIDKFYDIKDEFDNISDMDASKLKNAIAEINDVSIELANAIQHLSKDQLKQFRINDKGFVAEEIDELINGIKNKHGELNVELGKLEATQRNFLAGKKMKASGSRSLGIAKNEDGSNYTIKAKIIPDVNDKTWVDEINGVIKRVEGQIDKVKLTPTFSKRSQSVEKELEGNLAQINHAIQVDLKVEDNILQFNDKINRIDKSIQNAKQQLEKNGNFKIRFDYEEGGKFKDVAYQIINKFKKIDSNIYVANGKKFIQDVSGLRTKATNELKDIPANFVIGNQDDLFAGIGGLKTNIDDAIGKIGVNLELENLDSFLLQAVELKNDIQTFYGGSPVVIVPEYDNTQAEEQKPVSTSKPRKKKESTAKDTGLKTAVNDTEQLSKAAKGAQTKLSNIKKTLESLKKDKFDSKEFIELGDVELKNNKKLDKTIKEQKIKESNAEIQKLINLRKELQKGSPDNLKDTWQTVYPEANGDINVARKMYLANQDALKEVESMLQVYYDKQVASLEKRAESAQKIIDKEKELAKVNKEQDKKKKDNAPKPPKEKQLKEKPPKDQEPKIELSKPKTKDANIGPESKLKAVIEAEEKALNDIEAARKVLDTYTDHWDTSSNFIKLGEFDEESGVFKKNSKEMQGLIKRYNELKNARKAIYEEELKKNGVADRSLLSPKPDSEERKISTRLAKAFSDQKRVYSNQLQDGINEFRKQLNERIKLQGDKPFAGAFDKLVQHERQKIKDYKSGKYVASDTKNIQDSVKAQEELNQTLERQRAIFKDLEKNGRNSKYFTKLGQWDGASGSFDEDAKKVQELIDKYNVLKNTRKEQKISRPDKNTEEGKKELQLNGQINGILRSQKQHLADIIAQNERELQSVQKVTEAYGKKADASKVIEAEIKGLQDQLAKIEAAKKILDNSNIKNQDMLLNSGFGDLKHRIKEGSTEEDLRGVIETYRKSAAHLNELSQQGKKGTNEFETTQWIHNEAKSLLKTIRTDQREYAAERSKKLREEIAEKQKLLQVEKDKQKAQKEEEKKQEPKHKQKPVQQKPDIQKQDADVNAKVKVTQKALENQQKLTLQQLKATTSGATPEVVKLDLGVLAKDGTLQSIDGKVGNILSSLGKGLNLSGKGITIKADNIKVDGEVVQGSTGKKGKQKENVHYVTDKQGNQKYMYRGIHDAHGALVSNREHGGTFFTDNIKVAQTYAKELGKIEKVLLSMNNPLEIDADGKNWDNIEYIGSGSDDVSKRIHELKALIAKADDGINEWHRRVDEGTWKEDDAFLQKRLKDLHEHRQQYQNELNAIYMDTSNPYGKKTTNDMVEFAKSNGYDGVIFNNIFDNASNAIREMSTVMVTFAQDQVHYIETIKATFENAIQYFKQEFSDFIPFMNMSSDDVKNELLKVYENKYKFDAGEMTDFEYAGVIAQNPLASLWNNLAIGDQNLVPFTTQTIEPELGIIASDISDYLSKMRERLQKIATTFGMDNINLDQLLSMKGTSDVDTANKQIEASASNAAQEQQELNSELAETKQKASQINISNANQDIVASAEQATQEQKELNDELERTRQASQVVETFSENKGEVTKRIKTYRSKDKTTEQQEIYRWVKRDKDDPGQLEHTATVFKTNMEAYDRLYENYIKSLSKQLEIEQKIKSSSGSTSKLKEDLKLQQDITKNLESQLSSHDELFTTESKRAAMAEATKRAEQAVKTASAGKEDAEINKRIDQLNKAIENTQDKYDNMVANQDLFREAGMPLSDTSIEKITEYGRLIDELKIKQQEIAQTPSLIKDKDYSKGLKKLLDDLDKTEQKIDELSVSAAQFLQKLNSTSDIHVLDNNFDPKDINQMHDAMRQFANGVGVGEAKLIGFNDANHTATFQIKNSAGELQQLTVEYNQATNALGRYVSKTNDSVSTSQKFFGSIKQSFANVGKYLLSFGSVYEVFAWIRQGFTYVREIDSALTELKKVTNETDATYDAFLQTMSKTSSVVGSTVSDLTTMAAEWARLGYTLEEAGTLAESTAILLNVSEFNDATEASEALISTMQAFQYTADESQHVVDILNEVGNNYAVSSDGIATALKTSASALMESGTDLEQATALVAAANKVVQDPSSVGSALRTISLRLRGTSVELLEEMGEETDGVVESTSKLQEKLKALTGVDILTDAGAYKDTYTILKEIGSVWKDIDPMDQAAALELMAGKNRANTLAAILNNMKDLEGAYESAMNAEGSALRENEAFLNSIEGRIKQLTTAIQTMWMNFMNDEAVKVFVSLLTHVVELIDHIGLLNIAVATLFGILSYKKDINIFTTMLPIVKSLGTGIVSLVKHIYSWVTGLMTARTSAVATTTATNALTVATNAKAAADVKATATTFSLRTAFMQLGTSATFASVGIALATAGLSILAGLALPHIIEWFDDLYESAEETAEKVKELTDEYKVAKKEFSEKLDMLTISSDTEKYGTLLKEFEQLTAGVNEYGENVSLTADEYERYLEICNLIVGVNPSIADGYNSAAEAIGNNAGALRELIELQKEQARLAAAEYVSMGRYSNNGNFEDLVKNAQDEYKTAMQNAYKYTNFDGENYLGEILEKAFDWSSVGQYDYGNKFSNTDDMAKFIMDMIGLDTNQLDQYYNELGEFDFDSWIDDFADDIAESKQQFIDRLEKMRTDDSPIGDPRSFASLVLGFSEEELRDAGELKSWQSPLKIINNFMNDDGSFDYDSFSSQYGGYIGKYKDFFIDNAKKEISDWADGFNGVTEELESARDGMIDELLEVPNAIKGYSDLNTGTRSFVTEWIKNNPAFKFEGEVTEEAAKEQFESARETIANALNNILGNDALSEMFNQMSTLDKSKGTFAAYKEQVSNLFKGIYDELNKDGNAEEIWGLTDDNYVQTLAVKYKLEWMFNEDSDGHTDVDKFAAEVARITGEDASVIADELQNMKPIEVTRLVAYNLSAIPHDGKGSWQDIKDAALATVDSQPSFKTYSTLATSVESLNEAMTASKELFADGAKTTEDYYKSLIELGIEDKELAKCIDKTNGYIVTNADELQKLIKAQKEELAAETKLAKSHAQLKYYDLIKELDTAVEHYNALDQESEDSVNSLLSQANAIKNSINQYQLLEDTLLGATNAFDEFGKAQERDAQNTYGATYTEMAQVMYDALYKTGQVGSEQFWAAVQANVPDDIYAHLVPGQEQIKAIADYANKNIFSTLTLSGESFSIDYSEIEEFIERAQNVGLFTGTDAKSFGLSQGFLDSLAEDENALEAFAEHIGMTVTQVYAMLSEMDKYNANGLGLSMLLQLDNSTTSQLTLAANELERLYTQRKALMKQGDQDALAINLEEINKAEARLASLEKQAVDNTIKYSIVANAMQDPEKQLGAVLPDELIVKLGLSGDDTVESSLGKLKEYLLSLEEPTVVDLKIAQNQVEEEIAAIEEKFGKTELEAKVKLFNDGNLTELTADEVTTIERYINLQGASDFIGSAISDSFTTTESFLSEIAQNTAIMAGKEPLPANTETSTSPKVDDKQDEKPEPDVESAILQLDVSKSLADFAVNVMNKIANVGAANEQWNMDQVNALSELGRISREVLDLKSQVDSGKLAPEDAKVKFSELQSEARKFGIEVPVTFKAEPGKIISEVSGEQISAEIVSEEAIEGLDTAIEQVASLCETTVESTDTATEMWEAYNNVIDVLKTFDPDAMIPTNELSDLGLGEFTSELISASELITLIQQKMSTMPSAGSTSGIVAPMQQPKYMSTYSQLQSEVASYNDILAQTYEISAENIKISDEYKQSLQELFEDKTELNKCFEDSNENVVTNASYLKKLVAAKKKEIGADIRLARAQSQLEYYQLVDAMSQMLNGTDYLNAATNEAVSALIDQINTVQLAINEYQMLEDSLLGAANAFDIFAQAQQIDAKNTYGDSYVEMAQTMYDAFEKTGQVGTEAHWAAIEALIPPKVYAGIIDDQEKMKAIYEYFNKNILPTLTLDNDTLSLGRQNIEDFVTKGLTKGEDGTSVFTGTKEKFTFSDEFINKIEEGTNGLSLFAKEMGMTETAAYSLLAELDKYNVARGEPSFLGQLDKSLNGRIMQTTSELAQLNKERAALQKDGISDEDAEKIKEIDARIAELNKSMETYKETASSEVDTYLQDQAEIDGQIESLQELGKTQETLTAEDAKKFGIELDEGQTMTIQEALQQLQQRKDALMQPTPLVLQLASEKAQADFDSLVQEIFGEPVEVKFKLNEETGKYEYDGDKTGLTEEQIAKLEQSYTDLQTVNTLFTESVQSQADIMSTIASDVASINSKMPEKQLPTDDPQTQQPGTTEEQTTDGEVTTDSVTLEASDVTVSADTADVNAESSTTTSTTEETTTTGGSGTTETGTTTAPVSVELIDSEIARIKTEIENIGKDTTITPEVKQEKIEEFQAQLNQLEAAEILINAVFSSNIADIQSAIDQYNNTTLQNKQSTVSVTGIGAAKAALLEFKNFLDNLDLDKKSTLTLNMGTLGGGPTGADGTAHVGGTANASGIAHANGTAFKTGSWGAPRTETALVGELGPELLVRDGRWTTIGDNGAEFTGIKKGDIIFNHKQTRDLLSKGYVTGRGKAYAEGTAYAGLWGSSSSSKKSSSSSYKNAANAISKSVDDASEDFKEVFDWIAVRIEEITERLDLKSAELENAVGHGKQNSVIDEMIQLNKQLYQTLVDGTAEYEKFAAELLKKVPSKYREKAQNGAIDIEYFKGKVGDQAYSAIEEYREWAQKAAEVTQQAEETLTEISSLAKQAIDNIQSDYENKRSLRDNRVDQLDAYNALAETDLGAESENIYNALIAENSKIINILENQRNDMQAELNKRVESGEIKKYSQDWYDAVSAIAEADTEIIELTADTEDYQDAINDLHWDHFDNLITRLEAISKESENLIDILNSKDLFDKETYEWTDEGITALALYAQQLDGAEMQAKKYEEEIKYLNKNWKALGYTEQEYVEKLEDLKDGQYDAIKAYNDTKDAIKDLTAERVNAIKEGIQEEIDAYTELIEKKKEEISAEKDLYDFQKGVANQQKNIADIERKLAALSADNSASARAQRARLEAELAKARQDLQDTYYDRSIQDQQEALDKELENFREEKEKEIEGWDEYLEETEKVVSDTLDIVQANTQTVYNTLQEMGKEYSLSIAEAITSPWKQGEYAIQSYSEQFGLSMSATVEELRKIATEYKNFIAEIEGYGQKVVGTVGSNAQKYQSGDAENPSGSTTNQQTNPINVGSKVDAGNAQIYSYAGAQSGSKQYYANDPVYTVLAVNGNWVQVRHHKQSTGATGWFKKNQLKAYAKGTKAMDKDQFALIDELGEELVIRPSNGRMAFFEKGTGVIPADLTENLMEWGELDPSTMLNQNKPEISMSPSVVNNNMELHIDASVGELIHVDQLNGNNIAEVTKVVDKAWNKYMKELNANIRRYTNR